MGLCVTRESGNDTGSEQRVAVILRESRASLNGFLPLGRVSLPQQVFLRRDSVAEGLCGWVDNSRNINLSERFVDNCLMREDDTKLRELASHELFHLNYDARFSEVIALEREILLRGRSLDNLARLSLHISLREAGAYAFGMIFATKREHGHLHRLQKMIELIGAKADGNASESGSKTMDEMFDVYEMIAFGRQKGIGITHWVLETFKSALEDYLGEYFDKVKAKKGQNDYFGALKHAYSRHSSQWGRLFGFLIIANSLPNYGECVRFFANKSPIELVAELDRVPLHFRQINKGILYLRARKPSRPNGPN